MNYLIWTAPIHLWGETDYPTSAYEEISNPSILLQKNIIIQTNSEQIWSHAEGHTLENMQIYNQVVSLCTCVLLYHDGIASSIGQGSVIGLTDHSCLKYYDLASRYQIFVTEIT